MIKELLHQPHNHFNGNTMRMPTILILKLILPLGFQVGSGIKIDQVGQGTSYK